MIMSNKKQTALDWLEKQLNPDLTTMQGHIVLDLILRAKELEKEQIIKAHGNKVSTNLSKGANVYEIVTGKQYYQETYGKE